MAGAAHVSTTAGSIGLQAGARERLLGRAAVDQHLDHAGFQLDLVRGLGQGLQHVDALLPRGCLADHVQPIGDECLFEFDQRQAQALDLRVGFAVPCRVVDDDQVQLREAHALAEERVGAERELDVPCVVVDDSVAALGRLARAVARRLLCSP